MRAMVIVAILVAARAGAADRGDKAPLPQPPSALVQLVWNDPNHMLPTGFEEMAHEVRGIFRPLGIDVAWRRGGDRPVSGDELNVILLAADPAGRLHQRTTMGRVERTAHTALWIFAGRVRQTIGLDRASIVRATLQYQRDYPRALGRVVAHELVHAIAPTEPHAARGLMQANLTGAVLTGPRLAIDEGCARAFVRELASRSGADPGVLVTEVSAGER